MSWQNISVHQPLASIEMAMQYLKPVRRDVCSECKRSVNFVLDEGRKFYFCAGDTRNQDPKLRPGCGHKVYISNGTHPQRSPG